MPSGIARRRAAKAARRKKVLAERRKLTHVEEALSLAARIRRLAGAPLHCCLVQQGLFELGCGTVVLVRKTVAGRMAQAVFFLDVFCFGIKDVVFHEADILEIEETVAALKEASPLAPADPSYARRLLHDLAAWARTHGFAPHADYAAVELLFGDSSAETCDISFCFGRDGRPVYIPGPDDPPARMRQQVEQLRCRLGEDGFDFCLPTDEGATGYDPDRAPDPAEWLALGEEERLSRIEDYHRFADIDVPNLAAHAALHLAVENQIALGEPLAVRRAMKRLTAGGLDRHEALHAVAAALVENIRAAVQVEATSLASLDPYTAALKRLTAESWLHYWDAEDEPFDGA